ncbi:MAG: hypothetical protein JWL90_358 [Chthoniobacteraceae bacterium]|nr:hypothetical protein [Chthoniobacteraceae bacterium]
MNGVLLPWASSPRFGLIGNPENRRIRGFQQAVKELGGPVPACLSYEELLRDSNALKNFEVDLLRIESPGENDAVATGLIALGGGPARPALEFGEIGFLKEYHRGFCQMLARIGEHGAGCLNSPGDIAVAFDKWKSHQRFVANEVKRPVSELAPSHFNALREQMRAKQNGRLFLKPLHGSSASGVCALRWTRHHQQLIAPLQVRSARGSGVLVNSLAIRTYTTFADIEFILGFLLPQGMISEQWIPKLTLPGGAIDLRVLVIDGEARHWVVRQSRHPMTNLHLGNRRGDKEALLEIIGSKKLEEAFELAVRAAACFPDSLSVGVDILLDSRHQALVGEINAFGDLLPGLTDRNESAYEAIACHLGRLSVLPAHKHSQ